MTKTNDPEKSRSAQPEKTCCPIVELRQYTLHPGMRDVLIDLFDREFVESQEALGMRIIGQFRDLDKPDRFVWLRGFRDMPARAQSLKNFYGGPVWKTHREAANATMIDSGNVLLLRPARPGSGFSLENSDRPPPGGSETPRGLVVATIYHLNASVEADFTEFFERELKPVVTHTGASVLAYFVTENAPNNFPALPVREGENVFVWFSCFRNQSQYNDHVATLAGAGRWRDDISDALQRGVRDSPEVLRLLPTARSQLQA